MISLNTSTFSLLSLPPCPNRGFEGAEVIFKVARRCLVNRTSVVDKNNVVKSDSSLIGSPHGSLDDKVVRSRRDRNLY